MSYEDFLKAVKEDAVKTMMHAFEKEEAEAKINEAWQDMYDSFGDKMFSDQYEDVKHAEKSFSEGKMKEDVYKGRIKNAINTASWNLWMLA